MSSQSAKRSSLPLLAMLLAWLVPGAGHVYLGRVKRGVIIFVTVTVTFWAGMAIGGVSTADSRNERWWFIADTFTGGNGLVAWQKQNSLYEWLDWQINHDEEYLRLEQNAYQQFGSPQAAAVEIRRLRSDFSDKVLAAHNLALTSPGDTVARAYCGVAGLLNLMCIFDAVLLSLMGVRGEPANPNTAGKEEASS